MTRASETIAANNAKKINRGRVESCISIPKYKAIGTHINTPNSAFIK